MPDTRIPAITKISKKFDIPGYVFDSEVLQRINEIAIQAVVGPEGDQGKGIKIACWGSTSTGNRLKFETTESLATYLSSESTQFRSISVEYTLPGEAGISLVFQPTGRIELSAFGKALDFQFNIDKLMRELLRCDQEYGWLVRTFVFPAKVRRLLTGLTISVSLFLLANIGYYLYARNVGVNIDPSLIPSGNTYFQEVEHALKSDSLSRKLDVLLMAQLRSFRNAQDILYRQEGLIVYSLIALAVIIVSMVLLKVIVRLYPLSFFAFGYQSNVLSRLQRKREIWGVAVLLAFILNVIAGLLITFLD